MVLLIEGERIVVVSFKDGKSKTISGVYKGSKMNSAGHPVLSVLEDVE